MRLAEPSISPIVRDGVERACTDFDVLADKWGFRRAKARTWSRSFGDVVETIYFHRNGSSYGASRTASVDLRVHFASNPSASALVLNGPSSEALRDSRGYAYHLRFNAESWSTYERCITDLQRVVEEHGLPWFGKARL